MRKITAFILITLGSFIPADTHAQKKGPALIDSLQHLLATTQKDPTRQRAGTLTLLGNTYLFASDYLHSAQCLEESLSLSEQLADHHLEYDAWRALGVLRFRQHDLNKAQQCDSTALSLARADHNLQEQASTLKGMGDNYLQLGDSSKATGYFNQALTIFRQLGDRQSQATVYSNQSILCNENYQRKIELGLMAKKIFDTEPPGNVLPIINTGNIGVAYLDIVRYNRLSTIQPSGLIPADRQRLLHLSEKYLQEAIQMGNASKDVENAAYFTGVLAELQEQKGDFKNAYHNFRKYQDVTDSLFSQETKNKIAALESKGTLDRKNEEIENEKLQIANQHKKMWLLAGCILFLLATGALLIRLNGELSKANKIKAKFFGILSHDLRSPLSNLINLIEYHKLKPGALSQQEIADRENRITDSARSLLDKMDAVLLWSKGQMEQFKPTIRPVPAADLFAYLQQYFTDTPHILFAFEGDSQLMFTTDEQYLQTIMHNLTANAVKALQHTEKAQITWKAWQDSQKACLSVTDNGAGMRNEQLVALYDPTAVSGSRKGLGFHIIRDLAKAIGCNITLQPHTGPETVFVLSF